jgi:hypothetical protein
LPEGRLIVISTVTTSTVTTVALAGSFAVIGILVLLSMLIQKEVAGSAEGGRLQKFGQILNIGIVPLLIAFVLIVITKVVAVLQ